MPTGGRGGRRVGEHRAVVVLAEAVARRLLLVGRAAGEIIEVADLIDVDDLAPTRRPQNRVAVGDERADQRVQAPFVEHHASTHGSSLVTSEPPRYGRRSRIRGDIRKEMLDEEGASVRSSRPWLRVAVRSEGGAGNELAPGDP